MKHTPTSQSTVIRERYKWAFELLCLLTSALAIGGSVYILFRFDGEPIPKWSWQENGISMNSVLSILSMLSRSSLLVPLDEALGQLMWIAFAESDQQLYNAEIYNQAARGPAGALSLIWNKKGLGLASLGSFVMLQSLALGFAQQQLLAYPSKLMVTDSTAVTVGVSPLLYDSYQDQIDTDGDEATPMVDFPVAAAVYMSLSGQSTVVPLFTCESGDCRYPPFPSLGICTSCNHSTPAMSCDADNSYCWANHEGVSSYNYRADGPTLSEKSTVINQTQHEAAGLIAEIETISATVDWPPVYAADTCRLMWCIKTVTANVANSTYRETLEESLAAPQVLPDGTARFTHPTGEFRVSKNAQKAFIKLARDLKGWSKCSGDKEWIHSSPLFSGVSRFNRKDNTLSPIMAVADGMSAAIRNDMAVRGQTVERITIIKVRWEWLVYPVSMWVLSALFMAGTMWKSRRNEDVVGSWGTNSLALMMWGVRDDGLRAAVGDWSGSRMKAKAKKAKVRLVRDGDSWEMVKVGGEGY